MACVFLRTGELDLPIVRRRETEIENYWRMFFSLFSKKNKDKEVRWETVGVTTNI